MENNINGIALHFFENKNVQWKQWFYYIEELMARFNLTPHRGGVHGDNYGWSTYSQTYKGVKRKLEKFNFEKISDIYMRSLTGAGIQDKDPDEYLAAATLGFRGCYDMELHPESARIYFLVDKELLSHDSDAWVKIAMQFQQMTKAKYGYFFEWPLQNHPESYVSGSVHWRLSSYKLNRKWNDVLWPDNGRIPHCIRQVYRLNFLSAAQLQQQLQGLKISFNDWIIKGAGLRGSLQQLTEDFWAWHVAPQLIDTVYNELLSTGLMICVPSPDDEADALPPPSATLFSKITKFFIPK